MTNRRKHSIRIPDFELETIARALLPEMQAYFESEEGKREFAEWQALQKDSTKVHKGGNNDD